MSNKNRIKLNISTVTAALYHILFTKQHENEKCPRNKISRK